MVIWFANWVIHGSLLHNMFAIQNIPHAGKEKKIGREKMEGKFWSTKVKLI